MWREDHARNRVGNIATKNPRRAKNKRAPTSGRLNVRRKEAAAAAPDRKKRATNRPVAAGPAGPSDIASWPPSARGSLHRNCTIGSTAPGNGAPGCRRRLWWSGFHCGSIRMWFGDEGNQHRRHARRGRLPDEGGGRNARTPDFHRHARGVCDALRGARSSHVGSMHRGRRRLIARPALQARTAARRRVHGPSPAFGAAYNSSNSSNTVQRWSSRRHDPGRERVGPKLWQLAPATAPRLRSTGRQPAPQLP
jgi:hypothetical protein